MGVLSNKCGFQLQYQMIFSIWLLAFSPQMCEHLRRYNIIPVLSDILQESVKEKVTRIILAAFRVSVLWCFFNGACACMCVCVGVRRQSCFYMVEIAAWDKSRKYITVFHLLFQKKCDLLQQINIYCHLTNKQKILIYYLSSNQYFTLLDNELQNTVCNYATKFRSF